MVETNCTTLPFIWLSTVLQIDYLLGADGAYCLKATYAWGNDGQVYRCKSRLSCEP
jgi:hypothetical protein